MANAARKILWSCFGYLELWSLEDGFLAVFEAAIIAQAGGIFKKIPGELMSESDASAHADFVLDQAFLKAGLHRMESIDHRLSWVTFKSSRSS